MKYLWAILFISSLFMGCSDSTSTVPEDLSSGEHAAENLSGDEYTSYSSYDIKKVGDEKEDGALSASQVKGESGGSESGSSAGTANGESSDEKTGQAKPEEPKTEGGVAFDYEQVLNADAKPPVLKTESGEEFELPLPKKFDFGTDNSVVLEDFADNDHQNNLASALSVYNGQNHTLGGGFWYVFQSKSAEVTNSDGLAINAYNVLEAISDQQLHVKLDSKDFSGFAGVGTNILYEETAIDLTGLQSVRMRLKGSGTLTCYMEQYEEEPVDINKDNWGKYGVSIVLTSSWKEYTIPVSDFKGDEYSQISNQPLSKQINEVSKFLFQVKEGKSADIYIDKIEFVGLSLDDFEWTGERDAEFVFDPDAPLIENTVGEYLDFDNLFPTSYPVNKGTDKPNLTETGTPNFLHVEGNSLFDTQGNRVRLTGVNWFGFETKNLMLHGLWSRDYKSMLQQIVDLGFNCVRIPWSNQTLVQDDPDALDISFTGTDPYTNESNMNAALKGKNAFEIMTIVVEEAQSMGLKIILDNHSKVSDGYIVEGLWYTDKVSESQWISDWEMVAEHFKGYDAVVAMDLKNEPHFEATWGTGNVATDWNTAAEKCGNAILSVNPDVLIMVAGVEGLNGTESVDRERYWWGGNLMGVRETPIVLSNNEKLVYTPHEYGPEVHLQDWFKDPKFPSNMENLWNDRFGFVANDGIGHLFIGEFGIKEYDESSVSHLWFTKFLSYMKEHSDGYSFTYWAWNPNSSDTGGILKNDWSEVNEWKVELLTPLLAPLIGNNNG